MVASPSSVSPLGSPVIPSISGTVPGQIDPTQPSRVLRMSKSTLSFAAYDPRTAIGEMEIPDIRNLHLGGEEAFRPKRIVIETTPQGASFWRFVPRAKASATEVDEGFWPRKILICGQVTHCSLDQWDIYKLDPYYDCVLNPHPELSEIIYRHSPSFPEPTPAEQARTSSSTPIPQMPPKQQSRQVSFVESESDEEHANKTTRNFSAARARPHPRAQSASASPVKRKANQIKDAERRARLDRISRHTAKLLEREKENEHLRRREYVRMPQDVSMQSIHEFRTVDLERRSVPMANAIPSRSTCSAPARKRKVDPLENGEEHPDLEEDRSSKKYRTVPRQNRPSSLTTPCKRKLNQKRQERLESKGEKWSNLRCLKGEIRDDIFLQEIIREYNATNFEYHDEDMYAPTDYDTPPERASANMPQEQSQSQSQSQETQPEAELTEEQKRQESVAASIRKLSEFANDKTARDDASRRMKMQEEMQEAALKAKAEARKAQAAASKARGSRFSAQTANGGLPNGATDGAEEQHKAREAAIQRNIARRAKQQWSRWEGAYPWTPELALARALHLAPIFDNTKFSELEPLEFIDVPWPVLFRSGDFGIEDVTWQAVEEFIRIVRAYLKESAFKTFIQETQRRFHPDRWRSRNLLPAILNLTLRNCMEVAANAVAQAVTPVWQSLRD